MEIFLIILAFICVMLAIIGSIVPAIPGPVLAYLALWIAKWSGYADFSPKFMLIMAGVTLIVFLLDYILPPLITRKMGGSKAASSGALIGTILGMFLTPVGMLLGMLIGAFVGELVVAKNDGTASIKAAFGAFIGFLVGTGMKLIFCLYILTKVIIAVSFN